jgi:prophage antirepressor-like protein
MQEIQIFTNKMFGDIRTLPQENGEVLFVGKDVAQALGYAKSRNALAAHVDADDKKDALIQGPLGGKQRMTVINESGLYSLVLSSKLPQAKAFKRWVTGEVLPQIRRTGGFIPTHNAEGRQLTEQEILDCANDIIARTLGLLNAPNANCMTATEVARSWGMDVMSFNQLLHRMGIQYRKGGRWNLPPQLAGQGLAEVRTFMYYSLSGGARRKEYLVWTPKGVQFLNHRIQGMPDAPRSIQLNFFINN